MEKYFWDLNPSRTAIVETLQTIKQKSANSKEEGKSPDCIHSLSVAPTDEQIIALREVKEFKQAVTELFNEGEDIKSLDRYKNSVKYLLFNVKLNDSSSDVQAT